VLLYAHKLLDWPVTTAAIRLLPRFAPWFCIALQGQLVSV